MLFKIYVYHTYNIFYILTLICFFFIKGCTKSSIGAFQCGFNAGGQVACDGFSNNPQYLLTVNEGMFAPILMSL